MELYRGGMENKFFFGAGDVAESAFTQPWSSCSGWAHL